MSHSPRETPGERVLMGTDGLNEQCHMHAGQQGRSSPYMVLAVLAHPSPVHSSPSGMYGVQWFATVVSMPLVMRSELDQIHAQLEDCCPVKISGINNKEIIGSQAWEGLSS